MKSGTKTSEFYLAVASILTTILNEKLGLNIDPVALASVMGVVAAYIYGRSVVKKNAQP